MAFLKIDIRSNLIYPFFFMITINISRIIKIIIRDYFNIKVFIIYPLLMSISTPFLSGIIYYFIYKSKNLESKEATFMGIELIQACKEMQTIVKNSTIFLLIIFCSFFNFISSIRRFFFIN